jgi:hypothetical protein
LGGYDDGVSSGRGAKPGRKEERKKRKRREEEKVS